MEDNPSAASTMADNIYQAIQEQVSQALDDVLDRVIRDAGTDVEIRAARPADECPACHRTLDPETSRSVLTSQADNAA